MSIRSDVLTFLRANRGAAMCEIVRGLPNIPEYQIRNAFSSLRNQGKLVAIGMKDRAAAQGPLVVTRWGAL